MRRLPTIHLQIALLKPRVWQTESLTLLQNPALRTQYYADRARVLNPGRIPEEELIAIEEHVKYLHGAVFAKQDVVLCDYNTAMSRDIFKSFEKHIVIFGNTHCVPFSKATAVIVQHSGLKVAFLLGHPADQPYGPMQLASRDRNEAMTTYGRSAWEALGRGSEPASTNVS